MLKHSYIVILALIVLFTLMLLHASVFFYLLLLFLFVGIEFYGATYIQSGFHIQAYCKNPGNEKIVSLTFDDGPTLQTEKVVSVLNSAGVKAAFFLIGKNIPGNEELIKRMDAAGHVLGNHSYQHDFFFDLNTRKKFELDLKKAENEIQNTIGKKPLFFRPPYGVTTPGLANIVKKLNYFTVGWNIRSFDTKMQNSDQVMSRIKNQLKPGSIILLHDSIQGAEILLKDLLHYLNEQEYKIVGLEELTKTKAYA